MYFFPFFIILPCVTNKKKIVNLLAKNIEPSERKTLLPCAYVKTN